MKRRSRSSVETSEASEVIESGAENRLDPREIRPVSRRRADRLGEPSAERVGFEPTVPRMGVRFLSKEVPSTTRPSLPERKRGRHMLDMSKVVPRIAENADSVEEPCLRRAPIFFTQNISPIKGFSCIGASTSRRPVALPSERRENGGGGIRTHERRKDAAGFQDRCLQPLGHSSSTSRGEPGRPEISPRCRRDVPYRLLERRQASDE